MEHVEPVEMDQTGGPFLDLLRDIDWVYIVGIFLTLLALFFSYDLISGQREAGTLSLVLTQPVSRAQMLMGTYLGAVLGLVSPLFVGITGHLLFIVVLGQVPLMATDAFRIGGVIVVFIVFLSFFVFVGLLISSLTTYSSTTLVNALMVWVVLVLIIPNGAEPIANLLDPLPDPREYQRRIQAIEQVEHAKRHLGVSSDMLDPIVNAPDPPEEKKRRIEALQQRLTEEQLEARWEIRRMQNHVRQERERRQFNHLDLARRLSRFSPLGLYRYAAESIADTGLIRQERFRRQLDHYAGTFTAFAKPLRRHYAPQARHAGYTSVDLDGYQLTVPNGLNYDEIKVPPQNFPTFVARRASVSEGMADALGDVGGLLTLNLLLFFATLYAFLRYDVRAG
jgi:ABC-2 type transport system permease protein